MDTPMLAILVPPKNTFLLVSAPIERGCGPPRWKQYFARHNQELS